MAQIEEEEESEHVSIKDESNPPQIIFADSKDWEDSLALLIKKYDEVSPDRALAVELERSKCCKKMCRNITRILAEECKVDIAKAAKLSVGFFPALVFECLSTQKNKDSLLPTPEILSNGFSVSLVRRCHPLVHDLIASSQADVSSRAQEISKRICDSVQQEFESWNVGSDLNHQTVRVVEKEKVTSVCCCRFKHDILTSYYRRLKLKYKGSKENFSVRLFILLQRYYNLTGCVSDATSEAGWHGAVPPRVMNFLCSHLGVSCECFASPLNSEFKRFFSAFPDTDSYFGSLGSFFEARMRSGAFEVNPPFDHSVVAALARRLDILFTESESGLCFVVVIPISDGMKQLKSVGEVTVSLQAVGCHLDKILIPAVGAPYIDGAQHCKNGKMFSSRLDTGVFVLYNDVYKKNRAVDLESFFAGLQSEWGNVKKRPREE